MVAQWGYGRIVKSVLSWLLVLQCPALHKMCFCYFCKQTDEMGLPSFWIQSCFDKSRLDTNGSQFDTH